MSRYSIVVAVLVGFIMCACSSIDEPTYSCNVEVNKWVKSHVDDIHLMTRAEWLESDAKLSIPIYRAFSPQQRISFWREKFQELRALPWSEGELSLIKEVESFIESHLDLFGPGRPSEELLDEAELFVYKWTEKAQREYSWSYELISSMVASGDKLLDTKGTVYKPRRAAGGIIKFDSETTCNCNVGSWFTCSPYVECENVECIGSDGGCGFVFAWDCNGVCEEVEPVI